MYWRLLLLTKERAESGLTLKAQSGLVNGMQGNWQHIFHLRENGRSGDFQETILCLTQYMLTRRIWSG